MSPMLPQQQQLPGTRSEVVPASMSVESSDFSVISNTSHVGMVSNGVMTSFQDLSLAVSTATPDMSFEQMHAAFQELLRENLQLKDDVMQSNLAMKEQFDLMIKLQMHVENIQKEQIEKHEKAKNVIEFLRSENKRLKLQHGSSENEVYIDELRKELANLKLLHDKHMEESERQTEINHQLGDELRLVQSDLFVIKANYSRLVEEKRELTAINVELQAKLAVRQQSPDEFYDASDGCADTINNQGFLLVPSKSEGAASDAVNQEFTLVEEKTIKNLLAQLSIEQTKNKRLIEELNSEKSKNTSHLSQINGQEEVMRRLVQPGNALNIRQLDGQPMQETSIKSSLTDSFLQICRIHCDSMENLLSLYMKKSHGRGRHSDNIIAEQLRSEIMTLRGAVDRERDNVVKQQNSIQESECSFNYSNDDRGKEAQNWNSYTDAQANVGQQSEAYYNLQEKFYQEKLDMVMAKFVVIEEKLAAKEDELAAIHPELQKLKQEAETIPILQTQVELYRTDFHAERDAREKMRDEREKMCEELRALQLEHEEVMNFIGKLKSSNIQVPAFGRQPHYQRHGDRSSYQPRSFGHNSQFVQTSERSTMTSSPVRDQSVQDDARSASEIAAPAYGASAMHVSDTQVEYICPKCLLKFNSYTPLEKHVNACLDNVDSFVM